MRKTFLRSDQMHETYERAVKDPNFFSTTPTVLDANKDLLEWDHWRVIPNNYPYDVIAERHDMLILKMGIVSNEADLSIVQFLELQEIKNDLQGTYDLMLLNFPHQQSQPQWLHYHLIKLKIK